MKFFGGSIPFKRLDPKSWRSEYIKRTRLLRRWEKGRGSNIMIDPKIGNISKIWAETDNRPNEGWFLAGGVAEGMWRHLTYRQSCCFDVESLLILGLCLFNLRCGCTMQSITGKGPEGCCVEDDPPLECRGFHHDHGPVSFEVFFSMNIHISESRVLTVRCVSAMSV